MTLRDLISSCTFKKTFNELYKNYFKGSLKNDEIQKLDLRYYKFFEYLKSLPENKTSSNKIYVTHTSGDDFVVDVCFLDKNKDELFALDFVDLDDIIEKPELEASDKQEKLDDLKEITAKLIATDSKESMAIVQEVGVKMKELEDDIKIDQEIKTKSSSRSTKTSSSRRRRY